MSVLERWHLLSLDAPCVATLWVWFLAHIAGVPTTAATLSAMFLAVWILYAGDRLLDARAAFRGVDAALEARHLFHARHRRGFLTAIAVAIPTLAIALALMPHPLLHAYFALGFTLAVWLGVIHTSRSPARLPKEFAVGPFFALAVGLPAAFAGANPGVIAVSMLSCAVMSAANCLFLLSWESCTPPQHHPVRASSGGKRPRMFSGAAIAVRHLQPLASAAVVLCVALAISLDIVSRNLASRSAGALERSSLLAPLTCGLSLSLLLLLHRVRHRFAPTTLRALADFALLTPLVTLPFAAPLLRVLAR